VQKITDGRGWPLDVEQDQVGRVLGDPFGRLDAVACLADDGDIGMRRQQLLQPLARRLFVVDQERANHCTFTAITVTSS
jgi:hypothetical protein